MCIYPFHSSISRFSVNRSQRRRKEGNIFLSLPSLSTIPPGGVQQYGATECREASHHLSWSESRRARTLPTLMLSNQSKYYKYMQVYVNTVCGVRLATGSSMTVMSEQLYMNMVVCKWVGEDVCLLGELVMLV